MITRRSFLKLSGAVAASLSVASLFPDIATWAAGGKVEGKGDFVRSFCEMCTSRCPIQAKVVDGKAVLVSGNPDWGATGGTLCARGVSGQSQLYDPQRVQKPLIRVGERGEGKWKEVSYEEAYDYIAKQMQGIKEKYGPEAMAFGCRKGPHMSYLYTFAKAYGSPNTHNHESTCPLARTVGLEVTFGTAGLGLDYGNSKYIVSLGRNYFEGINVAQVRGVMNCINKGGKLVSIDPRYSLTSAKAHEWLPIKPGTDLALVLALNHVLIRDGLYDKDFIAKYTEGFEAVKASVTSYTPAWAEKETGIKAADIERIAKEMAAVKPKAIVDWGWRTTFTPEEFELRRAIIISNMLLGNLEVPGGSFFSKGPGYINGLVGKPVIQGIAGFKTPPFPKPAKPRVDGAGVKGHPMELAPAGDGIAQAVPESILTEKPYPIKGYFVYRYNPVVTMPQTNRVIEAMKKLDLLVVCDIYMSDTAMFADVVLPESTYLERDEGFNDYSGGVPAFTLRQQVVKPVYNTRAHWQIFKELSERMGLGAYFPYTTVDDIRLAQMGGKQELVKMGKEKGFVNFGMKPLFLRDKNSVAEFVKQFPDAQPLVNEQGIIDKVLTNLKTPSKKIEMMSQEAQHVFGRGVPVYKPVKLAESGQQLFIQGKTGLHTNGHTHNVPWLHELMPENRLWMNPDTASKLGVKTDDLVEMASTVGKQQVKAYVTEGIRADTVFCYMGFGRVSPGLKRAYKKGVNSNLMIPTSTVPVCGITLQTAGVTLKKV